MGLDEVTVHARERLGMEIQAASLLHSRPVGSRSPVVWSLMTEHRWFWLVEEAGAIELFRATHHGPPAVAEATRRFLELHPTGPERPAAPPAAPRPRRAAARPAAIPNDEESARFDCRVCGEEVVTRRGTVLADRQLCTQCRHAERERLRYQDDPEHRARRRAYADHYRQRSERDGA